MSICRDGDTLVVDAPVSRYIIEPLRYTLGMTQVEMVDAHLARLVRDARLTGHKRSRDVEALLEARMWFLRNRGTA